MEWGWSGLRAGGHRSAAARPTSPDHVPEGLEVVLLLARVRIRWRLARWAHRVERRKDCMRETMSSAECFGAVVLAGVMAGLMLGTGMDQYTQRLLSGPAWVTGHQLMDALFSRVLPPLWNLTMISLAAAAWLSRGRARWLFALAAAIFLVSLMVTVRVEVPMNRAIALWDAQDPPNQWSTVRDRWLWFHLVRTAGGLVAFVCALAGLTRRQAARSDGSSCAQGG